MEVKNHKWIFVFSRHDKITKKDKITSEFALSRDCKKSSIAKALIWKFDKNYDPEPVIQWFEYEDGQVAKISKRNREGLD